MRYIFLITLTLIAVILAPLFTAYHFNEVKILWAWLPGAILVGGMYFLFMLNDNS